MKNLQRQKGATLLVGMIMLVVLTLLVVFAIRSSNTGLQIAANMQAQVEAHGAATRALETTIEIFKTVDDLADVAADPAMSVKVGDKEFLVAVAKPLCEITRDVLNSELNEDNPDDDECRTVGSTSVNPPLFGLGTTAAKLGDSRSRCLQQHWKLEASVNDANTGAVATQVQGLEIRVPGNSEGCT